MTSRSQLTLLLLFEDFLLGLVDARDNLLDDRLPPALDHLHLKQLLLRQSFRGQRSESAASFAHCKQVNTCQYCKIFTQSLPTVDDEARARDGFSL